MHRSKHVREARAIFTLIAFLLACCIALAVLGDQATPRAKADNPDRVEVYKCANAWYQKFEDRSGILYCGRHVLARVHVPY